MTQQKAYFIDVAARTITERTFNGLADLQAMVDGSIEGAFQWPTGDVLYVDEEGLLKERQRYFRLRERPDQPLGGNGVLVGREDENERHPNGYINLPPSMTLDELRARVRFITPAEEV